MVPTKTVQLVTIITEGMLENRIQEEILRLGARGYTTTSVHGKGTTGITANHWDGAQVKIETLVPPDVADKVLGYIKEHYFANYAITIYMQPVQVIREEKFG